MEKKPYVEPQTKVIEIEDEELICQSPGTGTDPLTEDDFEW